MKKVLVPTDFSINSKSGVRFAIHWATQQQIELIFLHVLNIFRSIEWTDLYFEEYTEHEKSLCKSKIDNFISCIYKSMNAVPGKLSFVVVEGISADISIMDYCRNNRGIDFICISTHGAGKFKRILGTNTGNLITKSEIPVLAVPQDYRVTKIQRVLYAADLQNYTKELKKVIDFALPFKATIEVVHFVWPTEPIFDQETIQAAFKKSYQYNIHIHFEEEETDQSLVQRISNQIKLKRPSVVIMFTNQERSFFQKLFFPSTSEELSFQLKVPLLVFKK